MKSDINFLYEIGAFRMVQRAWKRFMNQHAQNITEHTFRVVWISLLLAQQEKKVNTEKMMKMALVHDISESRTGDVDYLSRQYTTRDEVKAVEDIFKDSSLEKEFIELYEEYEKKDSIESKIVKDADNLDVEIELHELEVQGSNLREVWQASRDKSVYPTLYTEAAKKMWKEIRDSHPHDWHLHTRNRFLAGDWKD